MDKKENSAVLLLFIQKPFLYAGSEYKLISYCILNGTYGDTIEFVSAIWIGEFKFIRNTV